MGKQWQQHGTKQAQVQDSGSGSEAGDSKGEVMDMAAWVKSNKVWKLLL